MSRSWPAHDPKQSKLMYMDISASSKGMIEEPFTNQVELWNSLNII
jgi:hypothetical protein